MPIFNAANTNPGLLVAGIQQVLANHRAALEAVNKVYGWSSGISAEDLTAIGIAADDAPKILSAIADAHAEYLLHTTGLPPQSYPQPPSGYVYAASQNAVLGPT